MTVAYRDYIIGNQWKAVAKLVKTRANWACQLCGASQVNLNSHHSSYDRLGKSKEFEDCIALCNRCHSMVHKYILNNGGQNG